jgi:hypothetical protein
MAGAAKKAADLAGQLADAVEVEPWARSPVRVCQAAAAKVIGAQARLYGADGANKPVDLLLGLTAGLWTRPRIAPNPELDAINALSRFGRNLPTNAIDPVLELVGPLLAAGRALTPETAELLIQLYWAVPGLRGDLAAVWESAIPARKCGRSALRQSTFLVLVTTFVYLKLAPEIARDHVNYLYSLVRPASEWIACSDAGRPADRFARGPAR